MNVLILRFRIMLWMRGIDPALIRGPALPVDGCVCATINTHHKQDIENYTLHRSRAGYSSRLSLRSSSVGHGFSSHCGRYNTHFEVQVSATCSVYYFEYYERQSCFELDRIRENVTSNNHQTNTLLCFLLSAKANPFNTFSMDLHSEKGLKA